MSGRAARRAGVSGWRRPALLRAVAGDGTTPTQKCWCQQEDPRDTVWERSPLDAPGRVHGLLVELDDGEFGLHLGTNAKLLPLAEVERPCGAGGQPP